MNLMAQLPADWDLLYLGDFWCNRGPHVSRALRVVRSCAGVYGVVARATLAFKARGSWGARAFLSACEHMCQRARAASKGSAQQQRSASQHARRAPRHRRALHRTQMLDAASAVPGTIYDLQLNEFTHSWGLAAYGADPPLVRHDFGVNRRARARGRGRRGRE